MRNAMMVLVVAGAAGAASGQPIRAELKTMVGQTLPGTDGLTATSLNDPYTNGLGKVGFTGNSSGGNFVWYDTGVVWLNSDGLPDVLTGAEGTMGISDGGGFIYSPSVNGNDAVVTHLGVLMQQTDEIPALPGFFSTFNSRPRMTDSGGAIWVSGIATTPTGSSTNRCHLYVADVASPAFEVVIIGGGTFGGLTLTTGASNFAYDISGNGRHRVHILQATGSTAADMFAYFSSNDEVAAREGSPLPDGSGDNYGGTFRIPAVNNCGVWAVASNTTGATATNEAIVVRDAGVVARKGAAVRGGIIGGAVDAMSLNNRGRLAIISAASTNPPAPKSLIIGKAGRYLSSARVVLKVGDEIDVDGDGACDYQVSNFSASNAVAPGLDLADDGMVWVRVSLTPCGGGTAVVAIIGVRDVECFADYNEDGQVDFFDYLDFVADFDEGNAFADFNGDCQVDFFDYLDFVLAFSEGC